MQYCRTWGWIYAVSRFFPEGWGSLQSATESTTVVLSVTGGFGVSNCIDYAARNSNVRVGSFASILACPQHVRLRGNLGNAGCLVLPVEGINLDVMIQAPMAFKAECAEVRTAAE